MGYVPTGVVDATVMVMVELPEPGAGIVCGLKPTVVPDGMPEADRLMELLNPPLIDGGDDRYALTILRDAEGSRGSRNREVRLLLRGHRQH